MSRKQLPDPPRRHSLPVPSILPTVAIAGQSRSFPEGTDTFQRALEDLYISDSTQPYVHYRHDGLKQIQEGDEEEYSSDDSSDRGETRSNGLREVSTPSFLPPARADRRRHSMPAVLLSQATDKDLEKYPLLRAATQKSSKTVVKERANYSKEYFIKHGHWPEASKPHKHVKDKDINAKASPRRTNTNNASPTRKHRSSKT